MPTQPRSGSNRTKKTAAPGKQPTAQSRKNSAPGGNENGNEAAARVNETESAGTRTQSVNDTAEVTGSRLERREIPSFSNSREARIAEAAYWRAERRGFTAGQELDDWLAAEREVDEAERNPPV
jgi:hypothetical protein